MTAGEPRTFTQDQVLSALNRACDAIIDAAGLSGSGTLDALNLLVNATTVLLDNPDDPAPLTTASETCYSLDAEEVADHTHTDQVSGAELTAHLLEGHGIEASNVDTAQARSAHEQSHARTNLDVILGWIDEA